MNLKSWNLARRLPGFNLAEGVQLSKLNDAGKVNPRLTDEAKNQFFISYRYNLRVFTSPGLD
jgi:hypothetical protein